VINIGPPAHEDEREALRFLAHGLPPVATVFTNPWLLQASGAAYELDAIVVLPHAIFVVEIKGWRGHLQGDTRDWYLPETRRSPLLLARKTGQILHTLLASNSHAAGRAWVQELVFLPNAASFQSRLAGVRKRVALRHELHDRLLDPQALSELANRTVRPIGPDDRDEVELTLVKLIKGTPRQPPLRQVAGFTVIDQFDANERYRDVLGEDSTGTRRVLRIFRLPWDASPDELARTRKRATWEAGVLRSFARAPQDVCLPQVDPPVETDDGLVVPIEYFDGQTLPAWLSQHGKSLDLKARVGLWLRIAQALAWTHKAGVVHRQLRPECVLVRGTADPREPGTPEYRLTGFELAKRQGLDTTIAWSEGQIDALEGAAPEVVQALTDATAASDQFSLGLVLAFLVLRKPLVDSTVALVERRHRMPHLRDLDPDIPQRLDDAVARMVRMKPAERYPSVDDAIRHVQQAVVPQTQATVTGLARGALVGSDFLVEGKLGEGGLSEVYKVKHQLLGERFALKVARATPVAETAVQCEYHALRSLSHPAIVKAHSLSKMVDKRITVQLDLVAGSTLTDTVRGALLPEGDVVARRRLGEDLLSALDELERTGLSHNDLKPDNLMVTPTGRLVLIDFSLARGPAVTAKMGTVKTYGGTYDWRDPSGGPPGHAADRYAAAMCLFWLHAGRHPFDGRVPEPGEAPDFDAVELEPEALGPFFQTALHPTPHSRFRSARTLRESYLRALGAPVNAPIEGEDALSADTRLSTTSLHARAVRTLAAAQVVTVGELLALGVEGLRRVPGLGARLEARVARLIEQALHQGVDPDHASDRAAPPFFRPLAQVSAPLSELHLDPSVLDALRAHNLATVGEVAGLPREDLLAIPRIGSGALSRLVEALVRWREEADASQPTETLDGLWSRATRAVDPDDRAALESVFGFRGPPQTQAEVARDLGVDQPTISTRKIAGLQALDLDALASIRWALDGYLDQERDLLPLELAVERLARDLPTADIDPAGPIRLLAELDTRAFRLHDGLGEAGSTVLCRAWVTRDLLTRFAETAARVVRGWPPEPAGAVRRTLKLVLPEFEGDPVLLAQRLLPSVCTTAGGALFQPPISPELAVLYVLDSAREAMSLDGLRAELARVFVGRGPSLPPVHLLPELLDGSSWQVEGATVVRRQSASTVATERTGDDIHALLSVDRTVDPRDRVRDVLREAGRRGASFRLIVAPAAHHGAIGRSLITHLGATGVDLAAAWFDRHEDTLDLDARGARIPALRTITARRLDTLVTELVEAHGQPGQTVVLHNTGILEALGGLEQIRLLYARVTGQSSGLWVVVVPGVILDRQPLFNDRTPVWHQPGLVLPLAEPLRA